MNVYTKKKKKENECIYKKEENLLICNNKDEPWGHCAKWNKPDRERQVLYDFIYMLNQKANS